ncbi:predicted protein [Histoplasma capsulatum G186AR]|uniref:Uncharacterized protein n=1 Tax=Ajellomyces capsulatus (strain G186AR / H82 / ATCC MYA-2454 / RMSCC 2432) TaxID=447093 RepID=C0NKQ2_AJECG|nr:uncharacterized protein HCBG_03732 [Histoplasma capsulatum G186AR]EEH08443.1 predicted protein [Histoplasma capsulatum G186AR]
MRLFLQEESGHFKYEIIITVVYRVEVVLPKERKDALHRCWRRGRWVWYIGGARTLATPPGKHRQSMAGHSHRNGREGDINPINAYIFNKWGRWPSQVKPDPSLGARKPPSPLPTTRLGAVRPNQIRLEGAAPTRRIRPTERWKTPK